jgi:hypothetical protein
MNPTVKIFSRWVHRWALKKYGIFSNFCEPRPIQNKAMFSRSSWRALNPFLPMAQIELYLCALANSSKNSSIIRKFFLRVTSQIVGGENVIP